MVNSYQAGLEIAVAQKCGYFGNVDYGAINDAIVYCFVEPINDLRLAPGRINPKLPYRVVGGDKPEALTYPRRSLARSPTLSFLLRRSFLGRAF